MISGYSLTTVDANICQPLKAMWGRNFKYTSPKGKASLFGVNVEFRGASDIRSEDSIRGITLKGGLIDEANICDKAFVSMFMTRLRAKGAWATLGVNPDAPGHWIYKDFADKADEIGWSCFHFKMDDNTFLTEEYKKQMKAMFTGVFYKRFILGERVSAEGAVYPTFDDHVDKIIGKMDDERYKDIMYTNIGLDFGGSISKTAAVLTGVSRRLNKFYVIDECLIEPKDLTIDSMVQGIKDLYARAVVKPIGLYFDNMETLLGNTVRDNLWNSNVVIGVEPCIKDPVSDRLWFNNFMIENEGIFIDEKCVEYINSMRGAVYDKSGGRMDIGVNNPFCVDIQDAVEYTYQHINEGLKYGILDFKIGSENAIAENRVRKLDFSHLFK